MKYSQRQSNGISSFAALFLDSYSLGHHILDTRLIVRANFRSIYITLLEVRKASFAYRKVSRIKSLMQATFQSKQN